jgi:hypothetical protein
MFSHECSIFLVTAMLLATSHGLAAQQPKTTEAFNRYIAQSETHIAKDRSRPGTFLRLDSLPAAQRSDMLVRLHSGEVVIEKQGNTPEQIPDGLIHDWLGVVFIPKATVPQVIALVRDYDHLARYYSPDVMQSRVLSDRQSVEGDDLHVFMRLRKQKVVTVILDTEYDVHYGKLDAAHEYSVSRSTRITEIENAGELGERRLPSGHDHGYMWRLNTYWAFEQADGGVFVQCEAISLTRDIPAGLGWLVGPFVNSIPRESLEFTLDATRKALASRQSSREN